MIGRHYNKKRPEGKLTGRREENIQAYPGCSPPPSVRSP
jgi:hypothetical protein